MSKEPVILAGLARVVSAAIVAFAAKKGLALDALQVMGLIVGAEMALSTWIRSKVSPVKAAS